MTNTNLDSVQQAAVKKNVTGTYEVLIENARNALWSIKIHLEKHGKNIEGILSVEKCVERVDSALEDLNEI